MALMIEMDWSRPSLQNDGRELCCPWSYIVGNVSVMVLKLLFPVLSLAVARNV